MDNLELLVWAGALEAMDSRVQEFLDFDELVENINKAMKSDPLANSILQKLDSANQPKGWELTNGALHFQDWHTFWIKEPSGCRLSTTTMSTQLPDISGKQGH